MQKYYFMRISTPKIVKYTIHCFNAGLLFLLFFLTQNLYAREYVGMIDGVLDEDHWFEAIRYDDFVVTQPYSLSSPSFNTQVLIHSDQHGLYVGFINQQVQKEGSSRTSLRDEDIKTDFNEVIIDFDNQGLRSYGFKISRNNAVQDAIWRDRNREEINWNGNWLHGVSISDAQWQTEFFIPWSVVVSKTSDDVQRNIKLYFGRWHQGRRQRSSYPKTDRSQLNFMDEFATYNAVIAYKPQLDAFPFITLSHDLLRQKNEYKVGMDIFWKPTNHQQINLSLNPDFGQIESEDLVINFSAIETFYSEKRPFFRENNELFDIWGPETLRVIHTPRIGGESDQSKARNIDAALRLTQIGKQFDISLLSAFEEDTQYRDGGHFFALRGQYKSENWTTGLIQTLVDRPSINRQAKTTALDGLVEINNSLFLSAQLIRSQINHSVANRDGVLQVSDIAWWVKADFEISDVWFNEIALLNYGGKFDISDFGFVKQVDRKQFEYTTTYEWPELENKWIRDIKLESRVIAKNNQNNDDLPQELEIDASFILPSRAVWEIETVYITSGDDDLITRGGRVVYLPKQTEFAIAYTTTQDHYLQLELSAGTGTQGLNGGFQTYEFTPSLQIEQWMNLELEIEYQRFDNGLIWLGDEDEINGDGEGDDSQNLLGSFALEELSIAFNVSARMGNRHELRVKMESATLHANANQVYGVAKDGLIFVSNQEELESFSESEFAVQVRYRYEIGPLSEFYLVYSRGAEQEIEGLPKSRRHLLSNTIKMADTETIIMKLKYHF
jgi:hypothetical protein